MLEELREQLDELRHEPGDMGNPGDEEPPDLLLESVQQRGECQVELRILLYSNGQWHSEWLVHGSGVAAMSIELGVHGDVEVLDEHPLLVERLDDRVQLFFRGSVDDPDAVAWELMDVHRSVMGRWALIEDYWNLSKRVGTDDVEWVHLDPTSLLRAPAGMFAEGPVTVMAAYAAVLEQHGVSTSFLPASSVARVVDPLARSERAERARYLHAVPLLQQAETRDLHVLVLAPGRRAAALADGRFVAPPRGSHVIAEEFSCVRFVSSASGSWPDDLT